MSEGDISPHFILGDAIKRGGLGLSNKLNPATFSNIYDHSNNFTFIKDNFTQKGLKAFNTMHIIYNNIYVSVEKTTANKHK